MHDDAFDFDAEMTSRLASAEVRALYEKLVADGLTEEEADEAVVAKTICEVCEHQRALAEAAGLPNEDVVDLLD